MVTDSAPRKTASRKLFLASDQMRTLPLPQDSKLIALATNIDTAMRADEISKVRRACDDFLRTASEFYQVPVCTIRVLAARPVRVREYSTTELFGDYHPDAKTIRVWMRTAIRKEITSFGTFLSTLCHEFCHHLDFHRFSLGSSWHTRGFYNRAAILYHHAKGTPVKELVWIPIRGARWRIDWQRTTGRRPV